MTLFKPSCKRCQSPLSSPFIICSCCGVDDPLGGNDNLDILKTALLKMEKKDPGIINRDIEECKKVK